MPRRASLLATGSWVATRLVMVWFSLRQHEQWGDVHYYLDGVEKEALGGRALVEYPDATVIPLRVIGVLMVIAAGLTSWFFPLLFDYFIEEPPSLLSVVVLTLRNLLMLVVTVLAYRWAWVCLVTEHRAESAGNSARS